MLRNQNKPMIAFVLQSAGTKDFAIAKVREGAAGGQMPRLSKEFETGLPGGILGYQIDPNLVSKLPVWYQLFLFGILQKFGIRCKQIWYPTRDLVSSVNSNFLLKKLIF